MGFGIQGLGNARQSQGQPSLPKILFIPQQHHRSNLWCAGKIARPPNPEWDHRAVPQAPKLKGIRASGLTVFWNSVRHKSEPSAIDRAPRRKLGTQDGARRRLCCRWQQQELQRTTRVRRKPERLGLKALRFMGYSAA